MNITIETPGSVDTETPGVRTITLTCVAGIGTVRLHAAGGGTISTHWAEGGGRRWKTAIDALESLILAHACAGVDIQSEAYLQGVNEAMEALANRLE